MSVFTEAELEYFAGQRLGRIATVGPDGQPHVVPTSFRGMGGPRDELLADLESGLLAMEAGEGDSETVNAVFLALQTSRLTDLLTLVREVPISGLAVTMPLKRAVLDPISPQPRRNNSNASNVRPDHRCTRI